MPLPGSQLPTYVGVVDREMMLRLQKCYAFSVARVRRSALLFIARHAATPPEADGSNTASPAATLVTPALIWQHGRGGVWKGIPSPGINNSTSHISPPLMRPNKANACTGLKLRAL